jgi:hypothetical protein
VPYIVTDDGFSIVANRVKGLGTQPLYIGWGTNSTAPVKTDAALVAEAAGYTRATGVSSIATVTETGDAYVVTGTLTAAVAITIKEWGLFDAVSGGNLLVRETYPAGYVLGIGGFLNFTITVVIRRTA